MIYTSYYSNPKIPDNLVKVGISIESLVYGHYPDLAPTKPMFWDYKNNPNQEERERIYTKAFNDKISKLNPFIVERDLKQLGEDVVLLCFEGKGKFCHRNLVRQWLNDNGIKCEEL